MASPWSMLSPAIIGSKSLNGVMTRKFLFLNRDVMSVLIFSGILIRDIALFSMSILTGSKALAVF